MSRKILKTETKMTREDAAEKLHSLADKVQGGEVKLKSGDNSVTLNPGNQVEFELEVEEEKDGDTSIEVEIEWPENPKEEEVEIK